MSFLLLDYYTPLKLGSITNPILYLTIARDTKQVSNKFLVREEGRKDRKTGFHYFNLTLVSFLLWTFFKIFHLQNISRLSISLLPKGNGQTYQLSKKRSKKSYNSSASIFRVRRVRIRQIHN